MAEFKEEQRVKYKAYPTGRTGVIKHIEDNVAMVKFGVQDNRLIKLSELVDAEPPKPEPFKPGWYQPAHRPASNFVYYIQAEIAGALYYTHAYNPVTGEMDGPRPGGFPVLIGSKVLNIKRGDLVRLKFTKE